MPKPSASGVEIGFTREPELDSLKKGFEDSTNWKSSTRSGVQFYVNYFARVMSECLGPIAEFKIKEALVNEIKKIRIDRVGKLLTLFAFAYSCLFNFHLGNYHLYQMKMSIFLAACWRSNRN